MALTALVRAFVFALCVLPLEALVVGGGSRSQAVGRPTTVVRPWPLSMKSQEDKEFEEYVARKREAAGVDGTEDFGAGRRTENSIYAVGGFITIAVPVIAGLWAYNEGYLTPQ